MADKKLDEETGTETTGHSWDGIEELNTPLPRWWLWTLYATIVWGIGYTIAYPAWPMISGATAGVLGYSTRAAVATDIAEHEAKNQGLVEALLAADLATLSAGDDLHRYAVARGGSVFRAQCSQCHGAGAAGAVGYPNLLDDDWLWGGDIESISATVAHGVRNDTDDDARYSEMPAFGDMLEDEDIHAVVEYVYGLSSPDFDKALAEQGATVFADNCSACHGDTAQGDRELGAPNLADAIWLYGGSRETVEETVRNARYGVMPAWGQRLGQADIRAVSVYVHSLGGGE
ncbi:cytochrome-c oxidase, cbb3-type subunit III [Marinovum sp. 2_MG-2023]|uniref:cytochrome-c oxidase, cbb3-type subunit III n=1 Tax=unclassified Marinovum TaxID=2647166 RepID=UPI0026E3D81F|nr:MULTISPECIES: cytochrome-c oxidase, cbb3-type subunit III [unclassified Marinovum]MDO6728791.1 cytochrome-c oxidase, cbb3-type subunit III [Marinovum sp. 2_MG-2023]MDO6777793.1 cytochrome-c oxidase, cbb3-type subunit III [Marinovum sp. 1_MG-2023]